jgi:pimeloyl-ACP methyl ester carboxylesterase
MHVIEYYNDEWLEPSQWTLDSGEVIHIWKSAPSLTTTHAAIFLHGIKGNHKGLTALAAGYAQLHPDAQIIIPDLPGFGDSECFRDTTDILNKYLHFIEQLLDANPAPYHTLIGHSLSAFLGYIYLSLSADERVRYAYLFATQVTPKNISGIVLAAGFRLKRSSSTSIIARLIN